MSWNRLKEQGRDHFVRNEHAQALASYRSALACCPLPLERQILLSNMVACRLKLGGQAAEALSDAQDCVAINATWPKGHIRLASAYIALGRSNDACNALQKALSLDPTNTVARQMLRAQLRRDHPPLPEPSAPPEEHDGPSLPAFDPGSAMDHDADHDHDDQDMGGFSWIDRLKYTWMRIVTWYYEQSEETRTAIMVVMTMLVLYMALGGRFGWETTNATQKRGNYERGNAYDRYRQASTSYSDYNTPQSRRTSATPPTTRRSTDRGYTASTTDDYHHSSSQSTTWGGGFPNLFDGSVPSMLALAAFAYMCHRNGINPFHAIWMLNRFTGNRHRGGGMNRMGMYGMGYGMARNQFGARNQHFGPRPPRNGWW
jgi:tetratricopeptide (TPR) repeat protein